MKKIFIATVVCLFVSAAISFAAPAASVFQLRLVVDAPSADSEQMTQITHAPAVTTTNVLNIQKTVLLDQSALKSAKASTNGLEQPVIEITLTDAGAKKFADITKQNIHRRLAIIINGEVMEAPVVQTEISGGEMEISGRFTKEETEALAKRISAAIKK